MPPRVSTKRGGRGNRGGRGARARGGANTQSTAIAQLEGTFYVYATGLIRVDVCN